MEHDMYGSFFQFSRVSSHEQAQSRRDREVKSCTTNLATIDAQLSALRTINSRHGNEIRPGFRGTFTRYDDTLTQKKLEHEIVLRDSSKATTEPMGIIRNAGNLIDKCVKENPHLEEEIDDGREGTYDAATRTVDDKAEGSYRGWNPKGYKTVFIKPDQTEDET